MTDVGFGLIDRRTVIAILFSMALSTALFNNLQLPIDTTNASSLFADLVILTGYLYAARSLYRLPAALVFGITYAVKAAVNALVQQMLMDEEDRQSQKENVVFQKSKARKIQRGAMLSIVLLRNLLHSLIVCLVTAVFSFEQSIEDAYRNREKEYNERMGRVSGLRWRPSRMDFVGRGVLKILDRIGIVVIAALSTMPNFRPVEKTLGIAGVAFMLLIFLVRGDFTALVRDLIEKEGVEKEQV